MGDHACSSTGSWSRPRAAARSTTSTRPPRRCSAGRRRHRRPTCEPRDRRAPGGRSTRPTGRPTRRSARRACASSRRRSRPSRRSCAPSWSPRSAARCCHLRPPARRAAARGAPLAGRDDRRVPVVRGRSAPRTRSASASRPSGRCGRSRSASSASSCPWNFPIEIILNKLGPVLAMGNTCRAQARARHAVERDPHRAADRREDRHPARRGQHRDVGRTTSSARC